LDETPLFREIMQNRAAAGPSPLADLLTRHLKPTLYVTACGAWLGIMVLIVYFYMPTFLQTQYGIPARAVFNANAAALLMLAAMCPLWGLLVDRIGAAVALGLGAAGEAVIVALFFQNIAATVADPSLLLWWYLGISACMGSAVAVAMFSALSFP